jgi:DNA-binding MarR family transcriptional regulator
VEHLDLNSENTPCLEYVGIPNEIVDVLREDRAVSRSDENSSMLLSLLRVLSDLDKNFPLPYAIFLFEVARNEGCSLSDLQKATRIPLPTLSRMLWALSTKRQNGAEPYGLIEQDYAPDNHRRKVIRLSARGRRFISRLNAIIDQTAA